MSRLASIGAGLSALALSASLALAQAPQGPAVREPQGPQRPQAEQPPPAPQTLPQLYEQLKKAENAAAAQAVVRQIARRWGRSGSETADLLMGRARQAMAQQNAPLAVEILDRLIAIQPAWPEAWHVRGLAFFMMQDDVRALADFRETLRREPNHFMALGLTAAAFQRQGDERSALRAFRAVNEMHPHFEGVKDAIQRLAPRVDGRGA